MKQHHLKMAQELVNMEMDKNYLLTFKSFFARYMSEMATQPFFRFRSTTNLIIFQNEFDKENAENGIIPSLFLGGKTAEAIMEAEKYGSKLFHFEMPDNPVLAVIGEDKTLDAIADSLLNTSNEAKTFFKYCYENKVVPFEFIYKKFEILKEELPLTLVKNECGAYISLTDVDLFNMTFEDALDLNVYLKPMLTNQASLWFKSNYCEECGKFFFYERSSAKYCSDACRAKAAYKLRK